MKIISGMTVDLIRKREYGGNDEFVGTYKLGMKHPVPFRLIRNNETNEMLFEPILQSISSGHLEVIKIEVIKQSKE
ncbi:MAG: hypothetical protein IPP02_10845 [Chitinophagaceae bacterium]|nr:hypothetical protein [Chitinophagaceae bacterium]MBK9661266.1 hypothetical protein [Chitinophagaceae bacterium]MBK9938867.1 hypothetical protein [Chitinophagaceae bacterium]MBL0069718.1 hypothetical protein [Chitinophagaceae bacterium]